MKKESKTKKLSFSLENLVPGSEHTLTGYIDSDDITQIIHDLGEAFREQYTPELTRDEFWKKVSQSSSDERIGRTCVVMDDKMYLVENEDGKPTESFLKNKEFKITISETRL